MNGKVVMAPLISAFCWVVIFASMALPQKREDLCTLFWQQVLTPPASPVMHKMVLEYHFDHFILLPSAALIPLSVQSVGPNPLMNVFFWGFTWQHIPTSGQWTSCSTGVFYFIPYCQMFLHPRKNLLLTGRNDRKRKQGSRKREKSNQTDISIATHSLLIMKCTQGISF